MKTTTIRFAALLAVALSGCYAQLEEDTIVITNPIADANGNRLTIPGVPIGGTLPAIEFPFEVGEITIDEKMKESRLSLRSAALVMETGTGNFEGVSSATLTISAPTDPSLPPLVARYDRSRGDQPETMTCPPATPTSPPCPEGQPLIRLTPEGDVNLLSYLEASRLQIGFTLTAETVPTADWTGSLDLNFHILGKVTFP
jgi:hypothetical protein